MPETLNQPTRPSGPKHDAAYKSLFARRRTVEDTLHALPVATAIGDVGKRDPVLDHLVRRLDFSTLERMPDGSSRSSSPSSSKAAGCAGQRPGTSATS